MGYNSAAFLIALILFSAANPLAHGFIDIRGVLPGIIGSIFPPPRPILPPIILPPVTIPPLSPSLIPPVPPLTLANLTVVTGSLCCTPTGSCPGTPLPGVLVRVNCIGVSGVNVFVGQNRTDINGTFNISIPNILGVVPSARGLFPCIATVQLPINQTLCSVLSTTNGVLVGIVGVITTLVNQLLGLIQGVMITAFVEI